MPGYYPNESLSAMKKALIILVIAALAATGGFAVRSYLNQQADANNPALGQIRPEFAAPDINGEYQNIKQYDGKLVLLNFWATWCPPCKHEIPGFIELQAEYGEQGFQIVGLAIDDEDAVAEFIEEIGMNYPTMVVQQAGIELASRYGNINGVLPYSVLIDRDGTIVHTITGELSKARAKDLLADYDIQL